MTDDHARLCARAAFLETLESCTVGDHRMVPIPPATVAAIASELRAAATLIESLSRTRDEIRREAFEEAAAVADERGRHFLVGSGYKQILDQIAKAIREHIKGGDR